jgi:hypothetical protein
VDRAPAKLPNTCSRLIAMATSFVGSADDVKAIMKCADEDFRAYCDGTKEPSWPELDKLVTLIIREQSKVIARNREFLAAARRKARR